MKHSIYVIHRFMDDLHEEEIKEFRSHLVGAMSAHIAPDVMEGICERAIKVLFGKEKEKKCYCSCHILLDDFGNEYGLPHHGHNSDECECKF